MPPLDSLDCLLTALPFLPFQTATISVPVTFPLKHKIHHITLQLKMALKCLKDKIYTFLYGTWVFSNLVSADFSSLTFHDDLIYEQYSSSNTGSNTPGFPSHLEAFPLAALHGIIFIPHHNLPRKIYLSRYTSRVTSSMNFFFSVTYSPSSSYLFTRDSILVCANRQLSLKLLAAFRNSE